MTKIFIGGSRKMGRLNATVRARADNIIEEGLSVLIGDANGADKAMQQYLAERDYRNVVVFCAGSRCRNNVGDWETRQIEAKRARRDREFYTVKDVAMSREADYGFMLWDGRSIGTLNNILNLIEREKKVVVYFTPCKDFLTLRSLKDVELFVAKCDPEEITKFEKRLNLSKRLQGSQTEMKLVK